MKNKNILVTGGCGLIGSNFILKLLRQKCDITIIDNFSTGLEKNLDIIKHQSKKFKTNVNFYKINLCNKKKLNTIFNKHKFEYIFHFAAYSNVIESINYPKKIIQNNLISTKNLIFFVKKYGIKNFIFSSSASLYGNLNFKKSIKENSKLKPINPYGYSKLICEKEILKNYKNHKFRYCMFRYFNVVGRHVSKLIVEKKSLNLFETIYFTKKKNKCFYINGKNLKTVDGTPLRDFISMEDVVNAHMECIKQDKNKIFWNKIYNIGINKGITVLQIINQYNKLFKKKIKYELIEQKKGEIVKSIADNSKFLKFSNWRPKLIDTKKIVSSFFK